MASGVNGSSVGPSDGKGGAGSASAGQANSKIPKLWISGSTPRVRGGRMIS